MRMRRHRACRCCSVSADPKREYRRASRTCRSSPASPAPRSSAHRPTGPRRAQCKHSSGVGTTRRSGSPTCRSSAASAGHRTWDYGPSPSASSGTASSTWRAAVCVPARSNAALPCAPSLALRTHAAQRCHNHSLHGHRIFSRSPAAQNYSYRFIFSEDYRHADIQIRANCCCVCLVPPCAPAWCKVADLPCLTPQGEGVARSRRRVKAHDVRSFHPGQVPDAITRFNAAQHESSGSGEYWVRSSSTCAGDCTAPATEPETCAMRRAPLSPRPCSLTLVSVAPRSRADREVLV